MIDKNDLVSGETNTTQYKQAAHTLPPSSAGALSLQDAKAVHVPSHGNF